VQKNREGERFIHVAAGRYPTEELRQPKAQQMSKNQRENKNETRTQAQKIPNVASVDRTQCLQISGT
jgi:hypothetical protein